jgi:ribosomal protein S27E
MSHMDYMERLLLCSCGEVVVKAVNGVTKVRAKILVFHNNKAYAVCKGCGREVQAPVALNRSEMADLLAKSRQTKLFLRKG